VRPDPHAAIYRPDLGVAVMGYIEQATLPYIGLEVMPLFPTAVQSATFSVIPKEALLKIPDTSRSPRGTYNRGNWTYQRGLFQTQERGWEEPIDDSEREYFEQTNPGMAEFVAAKRAASFILRGQEQRIANKVFNTTNFTGHAVAAKWNDPVNAQPIEDINAGKKAFRQQCGMLPDALIISYSTFLDLKNCAEIVNRLKYTFPGIDIAKMTSTQLANAFDVPQVLVGSGIYDSAGEGLSSNVSDIWTNTMAALVKISRGLDIAEPGVGRTFLWTPDAPSNPIVEEYREEERRSDILRCRHHVDERLIQSFDDQGNVVTNVAAACMYLFTGVTA
jgi:hypothetical protein